MKHEVRVICRKCDEAQIVYCMYKHMRELTDEEIIDTACKSAIATTQIETDFGNASIEFARAILRKASEK